MGAGLVEEVEVGGRRIRVSVEGRGRPLLLLIGLAGSIELWEPLRQRLDGFETIAFDAPGTGGSGTQLLPVTIGQLTRLTDRLAQVLGFRRLDVLGLSFGGLVAQELALARPERVRRLVLTNTNFGVGSIPGLRAAWQLIRTHPRAFASPAFLSEVAPSIFGGRFARTQVGGNWLQPVRTATTLGWVWQLWAASLYSSLLRLHRIRQHTLVLAGDDDPLVPLVNARLLAACIPAARLQIIEGGGHMMLFDSSAEIAPHVERFLACDSDAECSAGSRNDREAPSAIHDF